MLLMAMCDAQRRFIWFDMSHTPSTHDSLAWSGTTLGYKIANGELPHPFVVLGDSAFTCTNSMITPGKDDDFNFEHSSLRINIECAFGELIRRWGILWRPLEILFASRSGVVGCCIRLHNFCIDQRLELDEHLRGDQQDMCEVQPGNFVRPPRLDRDGIPVDCLDRDRDFPVCREEGRDTYTQRNTARRAQMEEAVRDAGLVRPSC